MYSRGRQTKGLKRDWKQRARLGSFSSLASHALRVCEARALRLRKTLTPRFTDFFNDFEEKTRLFCSLVTVRLNLQTLQFFPFQPWWQKQVPSPLTPSLQVPLTQLHSERKAASCKILKELVSKTNFNAEWVALKRKTRGGTEAVLSAYASSGCWSCKASAHYVIFSFWIAFRWL